MKRTPTGIIVRFDDPLTRPMPVYKPQQKTSKRPELSAAEWQKRADAYQMHMGDQLHDLARRLGVDADALRRLRCGWDHQRSQWTFPERDSQGNVVGISTRLLVPKRDKQGKPVTKKMIWGSRHGLFYDPDGWGSGSGPVLLVEGASDTAAVMSMGLAVIGRPSNTGGEAYLADLLRDVEPGRQIIVVGENDQKPDGSNPGRAGAISTAQKLAERLGRPVQWAMPPQPHKDTREFLQAHGATAGDRYAASIIAAAVSADAPQKATVELLAAPEGKPRTLAEWRADQAKNRGSMIQPGLHLDRSPTGSGKTYNATEACKDVGTSLTVLPTHANCQERVAEMRGQGVAAVAYPELTKETCQRHDEAAEVQRLGLAIGQTICQGCQFAKVCQYQQQLKAAEKARHRVATHERLRTSGTLAYGKKQKGERKGSPVDLVVIDEMPVDVLAPMLVVPIEDLEGVRTLARLTGYAPYIERDDAQQRFADSLTAVLDQVDAVCQGIESTGRHPVELPGASDVPEQWQWLLLQAIRKVGKASFDPKALRLITRAATGDLAQLDIVTDVTTRKLKQPDGTTTEQQIHHHYLVGRFRPDISSDTPVILLDATGRAEDIEAATGMTVEDSTPEGHLEARQRVVQITDDITRDKSPKKVAAHIVRHLIGHPEVQQLGIIGHAPHISGEKKPAGEPDWPSVLDLLPASFRKRVAKVAYFGQGPDRGSNDWHKECDHLLVLGTVRPNPGDVRRWLVQHSQDEAAALPDGDWGSRPWQAADIGSSDVVEVFGRGYRHPEWHRAHTAIGRASLLQAIGRGRVLLDNGIPVTVFSNEPTGFPVAPAGSDLPASVVGTVQSLERLAGQVRAESGEARTDIFPIEEPYSENVGSDLPASLCLSALRQDHDISQRQAERRLADAVVCGVLTRPKRGWYGFPQANTPTPSLPAAETENRGGVDAVEVFAAAGRVDVEPVEITCTAAPAAITAVVSADICPPDPTPEDEMQAAYAPADADLTDADRQMLFDERSAIMEHDGGLDRDTADRLAAEAIFGRDAAARMFAPPDLADEAAARFPGRMQVEPASREPEELPVAILPRQRWRMHYLTQPPPAPAPKGLCSHCGHDRFSDRLIHGGRSVERSCARCDTFHSHPVWRPAGYDPRPDRCEPLTVQAAVASSLPVPADAPVIAGGPIQGGDGSAATLQNTRYTGCSGAPAAAAPTGRTYGEKPIPATAN